MELIELFDNYRHAYKNTIDAIDELCKSAEVLKEAIECMNNGKNIKKQCK